MQEIDFVIDHPKFKHVMSRDGKTLRESILKLCIDNSIIGLTPSQIKILHDRIIQFYDPIVWERAILYAHHSEVYDAVLRATSSAHNKSAPGKMPKGNKKGARRKDIDWINLAVSFDWNVWVTFVDKPRGANKIYPSSLDTHLSDFSNMYTLFINWLLTDFSYSTLYQIYDISRRYSVDIIHDCMQEIEEPRQRSVDYLMAVVDKEIAIRKAKAFEDKSLLDNSKNIINTILNMVADRSKPVDWNNIDKTKEIDNENQEEFNKVKLS